MSNNGAATETATQKDFYRIGEVSSLTDVKPFVLRYWEEAFTMLEPVKSPSGHRLYRQQDVDLVFKIKRLLYDEGFTIAGAHRHLREQAGLEPVDDGDENREPRVAPVADASQLLSRKMLLDLRDSLRAFLTLLERR
ncbi:MAG: MerR family transcriptional regulator [Acidobacteriota bacterium]|nr:MerR family transcriptional regulator [Acidobacteriota bacterium]